jgi:hypothetical protein
MEEEVFVAKDNSDVKALGVKLNCTPNDLHIYINGVDVTKNVVLEEIRITIERKEKQQTVILQTHEGA